MHLNRCLLFAFAIGALLISGCGGGAGGGGAVAGTTATPVFPKPTGDILAQSVTVTGTVPDASGTPEVVVNGVNATMDGTTWSIPIPASASPSVTIEYRLDGVVIDRYQTTITIAK